MTCRPLVDAQGRCYGFACSRGSTPKRVCTVCKKRPVTKLCDHPKSGGGTCDRAMCDQCTHSPSPGVDMCPDHHKEAA